MKGVGLAAVGAALLLVAPHANSSVTVSHSEPLQRLSIDRPGTAAQQKLHAGAPVALRFDAFGRTFDLRLEPNDRLVPAASRASLTGDVAVFRGTVAGEEASWARIVLADGAPRGLIRLGADYYAVEAPDGGKASGSSTIYRLADAHIAPGAMRCGAETSGSAQKMLGELVGELGKAMDYTPGATRQIDISAIGDYEFFRDKGGDSEAALLTRLNNVDGIFSEQLGVQIRVEELEMFTWRWDPFSDATDAGDLLDELAVYRSWRQAHRRQGLTHLYTGKDLDSNTVGIAFTNVLCDSRFGAGLTQASNNELFDSLVAAHELGHNFGAPHDGEAGSACVSETGRFIMAPTLNGSDEFSQCSINRMQQRIAAASCIVPLSIVDMTVDFSGSSDVLLLGSTATVEFSVANAGTETASGVSVNILLPASLQLDSVSASQGSCTSGAGAADCELGEIAGGSNRTVSLSVIALDPGDAELVATVSADNEDNPGNNEETVQLVVEPAVDLVVSTPGTAQATVGQATSIAIDLENRAALNATDVELSVSLDSELQVENASWLLGTCAVTAQQVDCSADNFPADSVSTLDLQLTATESGQAGYQVSLTSAEADTDTSNNSAEGGVKADAPVEASTSSSGGGGSGGGGAAGLLSVALLGWCAVRRARGASIRRQLLPY